MLSLLKNQLDQISIQSILHQNDIFGYLWQLNVLNNTNQPLNDILGQLYINYSMGMDIKQSIKSSYIHKQAIQLRQFDIIIISPNTVTLEQPFNIIVEIINYSTTTSYNLNIQIYQERNCNILAYGKSNISIGNIDSNQTKQYTLSFIPLSLGMQKISTLRISANDSNLYYDIQTTTFVLVTV